MNGIERQAEFEKELKSLVNRYSIENASNTPDYILAQYLVDCLAVYAAAVQKRETWFGRDGRPTEVKPTAPIFMTTPSEKTAEEIAYESLVKAITSARASGFREGWMDRQEQMELTITTMRTPVYVNPYAPKEPKDG